MRGHIVFVMVGVVAMFAVSPGVTSGQPTEIYLALDNDTLQRVIYDGLNTYTPAGSIAVPDIAEVQLFDTGGGNLNIFTRTVGANNNTLSEYSRSGSTLSQERSLDLGDSFAHDLDVQSNGQLTAFIVDAANPPGSRLHDYDKTVGSFTDDTVYGGYGSDIRGKFGIAPVGDFMYVVDESFDLLQIFEPDVIPTFSNRQNHNEPDIPDVAGMPGTSFGTLAGFGIDGPPDWRIRVYDTSAPTPQIQAESDIDAQIATQRSVVDLDHFSNGFIVATTVDTSGVGRLEAHVANLSSQGGNGAIDFKGLIEPANGGPNGSSHLTVDANNVVHVLDSAGNLNAYRPTFHADNVVTFGHVAIMNFGTGVSLDAFTVPEPSSLLLFGLASSLVGVVSRRTRRQA